MSEMRPYSKVTSVALSQQTELARSLAVIVGMSMGFKGMSQKNRIAPGYDGHCHWQIQHVLGYQWPNG